MSKSLLGQLSWSIWALAGNWKMLYPTYEVSDLSKLVIPSGTKLVILDKDNCFAKPHSLTVFPQFVPVMENIKNQPSLKVVVLSNTAGDSEADPDGKLARKLQESVGIEVFRHTQKKPMCYDEISRKYDLIHPSEILIVGDRLLTDVLMANVMGANSVWIRKGLHPGMLNYVESLFMGTRATAKDK